MTFPATILLLPVLAALAAFIPQRKVRDTAQAVFAALLLLATLNLQPVLAAKKLTPLVLAELFPGVTLTFTLDSLGLVFLLLVAFLWLISVIYCSGYMPANREQHQGRFHAFYALSIAATAGIATAGNMFTMFLCYELLTLVTVPLVAHHGTEEAKEAARTYLFILLGTSLTLLLAAVVWTYAITGSTDFIAGGLLAGKASPIVTGIVLALYMFGLGKAALMPVHRWLPAAMVAPAPVSALLHAVAVVKGGAFAAIKVVVYIFGVENLAALTRDYGWPGGWLGLAAGGTALLASAIALEQDNLKLRLAYSTISQLALIILALGLFTPVGVFAAVVQLAAHAFGKITLFFAAGAITTVSGKTNVSELDGIARRMPWTMSAFAVGALSMIGVPLTAGWQAKHVLLASIPHGEETAVAALMLTSALLNAAYFLPILVRACRKPAGRSHGEAPFACILAMSLSAIAVLVAGVFLPKLFAKIPAIAGARIEIPAGAWVWSLAGVLGLWFARREIARALKAINKWLWRRAEKVQEQVERLSSGAAPLARDRELGQTALAVSFVLAILLLVLYR